MSDCEVIRMYIMAMRGVDIVGIAEPRNEREWELFRIAKAKAYEWLMNVGTW